MPKNPIRHLRSWGEIRLLKARQALFPRQWRARRAVGALESKSGFISKGVGRTLFIDMSVISKHDAGTGIQRVVRALAMALLDLPLDEWTIEFVGASRYGPYARIGWPQAHSRTRVALMSARPGDVFIGLDYSLETVRWHKAQLQRFRRGGGSVWFLVHDLLPAQRPDWFSENTVVRYRAWLDVLASVGDGFFCNSLQTQSDLVDELTHYGLDRSDYVTRVLPMGQDIRESPREPSVHHSRNPSIERLAGQKYVLKIGTLEPRKGHKDLIEAFNILWKGGSEEALVLIGRLGWNVGTLRASILSHEEYGKKLIWIDNAEDPELVEVLLGCEGVLVSSYAEGYGLPLIEALGYRKPVLARDIPIFRYHEDNGVRFFPADASAEQLAQCITQWLGEIRTGGIAIHPPRVRWSESAIELMAAIKEIDQSGSGVLSRAD